MALPANLYVLPNDLFDYVGVEGVQLRLDDHRQATAQVIQVVTAASQGATSVAVQPLQRPLLPGSTLEFDGAGAPSVVEVVLSALGRVGDTTLTVVALAAALPALAAAQDNGVNVATAYRLITACLEGTRRVNLYCQQRYDVSQLLVNAQANGSIKSWARALAAKWLCSRQSNSPPKSVMSDAEDALEELKFVKNGQLSVEGIGTRTSGWPFMVNVRVDPTYTYAKIRVEPQISDQTPTQFGEYIDWNASLCFFEW